MAIATMTRAPARSTSMLSRKSYAVTISSSRLQHARALHFGAWRSKVGSGRLCDTQRRHRVIRYRCMDNISRKLSWDNGSRSNDSKIAMKRAMAHLMSDSKSSEANYVNADKVQSWSDDISGLRPGRNIEDAERDAIDHLFRSHGKASYEYDLWMSPLRNIQNYLSSQHTPKDISPEDVITATTNPRGTGPNPRATFRHKVPRPTTSRRRHQRQGMTSDSNSVIHASAPSASTSAYDNTVRPAPHQAAGSAIDAAESDSYSGPSLWNEPDGLPQRTAEETSKVYNDLDKYGPATWNEPDGLQDKSSEELSKNYPDLENYKPVSWREPNGLPPKTQEESSKNYDDLAQYGAVHWNEPDGLAPQTAEELSKAYDDLDKYKAVHWNEPDGLPEPTTEELSKQYDDLDKYRPVEWNEPDGLRKLTPEEESKQYDDLEDYAEPFTAPDASLEAQAASQMDATVKGRSLESKPDVHSELPQYEDLDKYQPVYWNEPDGLRQLTPEEESKKYADLHLYGAVQWNEPSGLPQPTPEEQSKIYKDLAGYESLTHTAPENVPSRIHPEEASKHYDDLAKYEHFENDGPKTARLHPEEASKAYSDLSSYQDPKLDEIDLKYPVCLEESTKQYNDLDRYQPVYFNEPDGSIARAATATDGLSSFDNKTDGQRQVASHFASEPLTAKEIRARMGQAPSNERRQRELDDDKLQHESAWDNVSVAAQHALRSSKQHQPSTMTGNYARDFPEDFTRSWYTNSNTSSLLPKDVQPAAADPVRDDVEMSSMDESFPPSEIRLEPALDRTTPLRRASSTADLVGDHYSKVPQGLETSYQEECAGRSTEPIMCRHHRAKAEGSQSPPQQNVEPVRKATNEGTYKILAYDRTNQSINVAEMTSDVLDEQPPLAPSEVLLKLSNPARFLPHLAPLQSQGFRVLTGSGDVLIFRKTMPGSPDAVPEQAVRNPVNPIDLMGKPVMGNFASPTGFVNYESLTENDVLKPEPPFRSNIDVRKEEAVFSGSRADRQQESPKKKGIGRRIAVGSAWAVGVAYAVGVLAEYFSTGGLDGLGPRGV